MRFLTYISKSCEMDAKNYGLWAEVQKLAQRIEGQQSIDNLDSHGQFLKKPLGRTYRLMIGKKYLNNDCLLLFWRVFPRGSGDYRSFCDNPHYFDGKFEQDTRKENIAAVWEEKTTHSDIPALRDLTPEERAYLYLPTAQQAGEWLISESEEWVSSTNKRTGEYSSYLSSLHPIVLDLIEHPRDEQEFFSGNIGALYRCLPEQKILFLISPIKPEMQSEIAGLKTKYEKVYSDIADRELILRKSRRAYPELIVYDADLWIHGIQETDEKANLALSKEEVEILRCNDEGYPLFINGRPGSGKSTILQYLFAEHIYHHLVDKNAPGAPLYLTYNKELLDIARENVLRILTSNSGKLTSVRTIQPEEAEWAADESFVDFREYLYSLLPADQRFNRHKYISFPEFRLRFDNRFSRYPDNNIRKITTELAWHVIRTYIKGMVAEEKEYLDPEAFRELTSNSHKFITDATYDIVYHTVWSNWYRELCEKENFWDDQDLARTVLMASEARPEEFPLARHSVIFCDEAQDFTRNELRLIFRLSIFSSRNLTPDVLKRVPMAFAGDPFQTLNPTGFDWESTRTAFYQTIIAQLDKRQKPALELNFKELSFNYRSTRNIVQLCNFIHLIRGIAFNKKNLLPQQTWFDDAANMPVYFDTESPVLQTKMREQQELVIIVPCQEGEELSYVQNDEFLKTIALSQDQEQITRNVLSPMRAKGQEFSRVVIYKFGEACRKDYSELLNLIKPNEIPSELSQENSIPLEYFINRLYVAASRAQKRLFIADTTEGLAEFWQLFEKYDPGAFVEMYKKAVQQPKTDSEFKWSENDLVKIQPGDQGSWERDHDDPAQLADEFFRSGLRLKDMYKLRLAIQNYQAAGKFDKKLECEGSLFEINGEYDKAADCFEQLGKRERALELYWKAEAFAKIVSLNENTLESEAARFTISQEEKSLDEYCKLLNELAQALKDDRIRPDEIWAKVIGSIVKNILVKVPESSLALYEWSAIQKTVQVFSSQGLFSREDERMLDQLQSRAMPYPEKLEILQKISTEPKQITDYYSDNRQSPLTEIQQDIVQQALQKLRQYDEMEKLVETYPSLKKYVWLLATYLREKALQPRIEPCVQKIFLFLIDQDLWEVALDFAAKRILPVEDGQVDSIKKYSWGYLLDTIFIKLLAISERLVKADQRTKSRISKYLSEKLLEQASAFYLHLTVTQAGAALERANRIRDCLEFYETVYDRQTWPATEETTKFAKERWLVCKTRQIDLHKDLESKQRIQKDIQKKQVEWNIEDTVRLPEFPIVEPNEKPESVKSQERKPRVSKPGENESNHTPPLPGWLGDVPPDPKPGASLSASGTLSASGIQHVQGAAPQDQFELSINFNSHLYRCSIMRESGKMFIQFGTRQEMVTLTAKGLKAHGSDADLQNQIQERDRTEHFSSYFIAAWDLTCLIRQQEKIVYVDLYQGDQALYLTTVRIT